MWLFIGLLTGIVLLLLAFWSRSKKVGIAWYEWLLAILGLALLLFTFQNYRASVAEFEPTAPGMFLLVFGLPGLVLLVISIFLPGWRYYRNRRAGR
jgi:TRAP-type uncharacterized transport system fused permease subunit